MRTRHRFLLTGLLFVSVYQAFTQVPYRVTPIYTPPLDRSKLELDARAVAYQGTGTLPMFDGDYFSLTLSSDNAKTGGKQEEVRSVVEAVLSSINWKRPAEELRYFKVVPPRPADSRMMEREVKMMEDTTRRRIKGRFGQINKATEEAIGEFSNDLRKQMNRPSEAFVFDQLFRGIKIEDAGIVATVRSGMVTSLSGRVFHTVNITNRERLNAARAQQAAEQHINKTSKSTGVSVPPKKVILPYGSGLKYAWKMEISAEDGPYEVWVDADNGNVLQLEPLFSFDAARGLVFNPSPNAGTRELTFEVDAPSGNQYRLRLNNVLDVNNNGADGVSTGDLTIASGSGEANFNVNPINGTVVNRTNQTNYNSRFQEVNVFAWVHEMRKNYEAWGSQAFPFITATVNHNNPCGFGINNACASGTNSLTFGIGSATTGTAATCNDFFNSAIDATVIAHEFGHLLNRLQYNAAGGTIIGSINEGIADYWANTNFNTDTFGAFWAGNCAAPVQSSFVPRQAEALDIFPEHIVNFGDGFPHSNGQIICWALWNGRQELLDESAIGAFSMNFNLIAAMAQAGVGVLNGMTHRRVHDSFLNLMQQLVPRYDSSRSIHKVLSGFARAGMFLEDREAVIDINDDFLDRNDAAGPTFTVWTGRDYTFSGDNADQTNRPFNTRFIVEVANDEAFTVNLISSGSQGGIVAGAGGTAAWQIPPANWNTLRMQDQLFYRLTTTNNEGGNIRRSGFGGVRPPGRAVINESGQCECACSASARENPKPFALITLIPLLGAAVWRRMIKQKESARASADH